MHRFLLVSAYVPPEQGGIQTYLSGLVTAFPKGAISVLAPSDRERFVPLESPLGDLTTADASAPYLVRRAHLFSAPRLFRVRAQREAIQIATKATHADVLLLGHFVPSFLLAARSLQKKQHVKIVQFLHGFDALAHAQHPLRHLAAQRLLSFPDLLVTTTHAMRDRIAETFQLDPKRFVMLPPGVTPIPPVSEKAVADFRLRIGMPPDARIVLCVARLTPRKGQDMLLRALPAIRARVPEAHLLFVGPDGGYGTVLKRMVEEHHLGSGVTFAGSLSPADLAAAYASAQVFCLPNRDEPGGDTEGFGIVLLEAMSAGLPVIGGNAGGVPEAIEDGVTGLLTNGADSDAIAKTVVRLLQDASLASRLAAQGKKAAEQASWAQRATAFQTIVEQRL